MGQEVAACHIGLCFVAYVMGDGPAEREQFWRGHTCGRQGCWSSRSSCRQWADAGRGPKQPPAAPELTGPPPGPGAGYFSSLCLSFFIYQIVKKEQALGSMHGTELPAW